MSENRLGDYDFVMCAIEGLYKIQQKKNALNEPLVEIEGVVYTIEQMITEVRTKSRIGLHFVSFVVQETVGLILPKLK